MYLKKYLFGKYRYFGNPLKYRSTTITFPPKDEDDIERVIKYPTDDGLILYLIKRIEKLENPKLKR